MGEVYSHGYLTCFIICFLKVRWNRYEGIFASQISTSFQFISVGDFTIMAISSFQFVIFFKKGY